MQVLGGDVVVDGQARGLGVEPVRDLSLWATGDLRPDVVLLLDLTPEQAAARLGGEPDRLEAEAKVRAARMSM